VRKGMALALSMLLAVNSASDAPSCDVSQASRCGLDPEDAFASPILSWWQKPFFSLCLCRQLQPAVTGLLEHRGIAVLLTYRCKIL